jgi:hypothetical protein
MLCHRTEARLGLPLSSLLHRATELMGRTWRMRQAEHAVTRRTTAIAMVAAFLAIGSVHESQSAEGPPSVKWIKQVGTSTRDVLLAMTLDGADNLYVTGYTFGNWAATNAGFSDALIAKYDPNGNECWARQFGTTSFDTGGGIAWDGEVGLYVAGDWRQLDYHLSKCSTDGDLLWTEHAFDFPPQSNTVNDVKIAADGSVYVCGTYGPLIKHDGEGTVLWTVDIRGGRDLVLDGSGYVYMTGFSNTLGMILNKTSPSGAVLWTRTVKGQSGDAIEISPLEDALYVAGSIAGMAGVSKYDMLGNLVWTRTFVGTGGIGSARCEDLAIDASGNVYVAGHAYGDLAAPSAGNADVFLRKYDPNGNDLWTWQYGTAHEDVATTMAIGKQGNIYIGGSISPYSSAGEGFIIALVPVPEPSTPILLAIGIAGIIFTRSRRRRLA